MIKQLRLFSTLLLLAVASVLWGQTTVTDELNRDLTGVTGTSYSSWSNKQSNSTAKYAGNSAGGNSSIQLRSKNNNSGVISTQSGGRLKKVVVTWNSNTASGRTINVYGKNEAYTDVSDLYNQATRGTLLGTIVYGTSTELTVDGDYEYIGMRSAADAMYIDKIEITWETSSSTTDPSIEAENVDIAYDATSGSIAYTIKNPTSETLSATTTSDWLTLGTVGESLITFTCSANSGKTARTATVTLTYGTATKNVTVTQAANPNAVDNISDITAAGTYAVQGTIVAKSQRGFIVGDGTGYVYYYNTNYTQSDYNIGDKVKLSGSVVAYGGVFEFNNTATITAVTESNYVAKEPTVLTGEQMDSRVGSTTAQLSAYIQYEGTLSVSGNYYNINNIDGASTAKGSISFPLNTDFTSLDGKTVKVTGYYVGVSSSTYYNTMLGSIEEVVDATPIIDANDVTLAYDATSGEIAYTVNNAVEGKSLSATTTTTVDWISNIVVGESSVTFTVTANDGTEDRSATITLSYDGAEDKTVTVTQKHFVADFATLPFEFNGGKADIEDTPGLTQTGLDTDYGSSPKLKFNTTGDELVLKFNERPGKLTFNVKGNPGGNPSVWAGTFKVQTSEDGITFTDLASYDELESITSTEEYNEIGASVRFIKWIYAEKASGNVALGNIVLNKYEIPKVDPELSFETTAFNVEPNAEFTAPVLVNPYEVTVAYSTSDAKIAAVNETTGAVTIGEKEGTATITASFEGDETYKAATASYTITVKAAVGPGTDKYELVTDAATLKAGDELLIAYVDADGATVMSTEQKTNNRGAVEATVNADGTVTPNSDAQVVTLEGETNAWYFNVGDGYLYAAGNDKNYLKTETEADDNAKATIAIAKNETTEAVEATIQFQGSYTRNLMRFNPNNGSPIFACYSSTSGTGSLPQLYRKVAESENKKGDVNNDGSVTIADVTTLVNIILGKNDNYNSEVADVNEDGSITIADVTTLVNIILGRAN